MVLKSTIRYTWLVIGWISLVVGVIGIFVPLLPTTPFVLLAGYCFSRGSEKMHHWIITHRYLGPMIRNWNNDRSIPLGAKILSSVMMLGSIAIIHWHPRIPDLVQWSVSGFLLGAIAFVVTRPTAKRQGK